MLYWVPFRTKVLPYFCSQSFYWPQSKFIQFSYLFRQFQQSSIPNNVTPSLTLFIFGTTFSPLKRWRWWYMRRSEEEGETVPTSSHSLTRTPTSSRHKWLIVLNLVLRFVILTQFRRGRPTFPLVSASSPRTFFTTTPSTFATMAAASAWRERERESAFSRGLVVRVIGMRIPWTHASFRKIRTSRGADYKECIFPGVEMCTVQVTVSVATLSLALTTCAKGYKLKTNNLIRVSRLQSCFCFCVCIKREWTKTENAHLSEICLCHDVMGYNTQKNIL